MSECLECLKRAREYEREVSAMVTEVERLHRIMKLGRSSQARAEQLTTKLYKYEQELNAQIDRTVDAKREALEYLSLLSGEERGVLFRYYILAMEWQEIAMKMFMSERRGFLLRKSALAKLDKYYGGRDNDADRNENKKAARACGADPGGACAADRSHCLGGGELRERPFAP